HLRKVSDHGVPVVSYRCGIGEAIRVGVHRRFNIDILGLTVFQSACEVLMSVHLSVPSDVQYLKDQDVTNMKMAMATRPDTASFKACALAEVYSCGSKGPQME
ncbi:MAG: hypothetical protein VX307_01560, partial [Chloroflexota bacterium]|nr:hypothetical protein [Chloroflexota bacterium]